MRHGVIALFFALGDGPALIVETDTATEDLERF
ncbi:hypothetical protein EV286_104391 [Rhizobium sp. BK251]|nr:hypothetical protein EV286_104391 [Rhizobium sp. BK251]